MGFISSEFLIQLLTAVGVSGIIAQGITSIRERRKIGAEAGEILQRAAGAQVERLQGEINDVRKRAKQDKEELELEIKDLRRKRTEDRRAYESTLGEERLENERLRAKLHARRTWEDGIYRTLMEQGIRIPTPPPWD